MKLKNSYSVATVRELKVKSFFRPHQTVSVLYEEGNHWIPTGAVEFIGIVRMVPYNSIAYQTIIHTREITPITTNGLTLTKKDITNIRTVSKHPNLISILSNQIMKYIAGYDVIKKALFLQQIKGVDNTKPNNIHILIKGDPSTGKSKLLKNISTLHGNKYINFDYNSRKIPITKIVKENTQGGMHRILKIGVIPQTIGTICIDDYMYPSEADDEIHSVLDTQTCKIKAGETTLTITTDCSILMALDSRLNNLNSKKHQETLQLMFNKFDIVFSLRDIVDKKRDLDIARHILNMNQEINEGVVINGVLIDDEFINKYITYARQIKPEWTINAKRIVDEYYNMIKKEFNNPPIQRESILKLTEAHAKARLSKSIGSIDAKEVIKIFNKSYLSTIQ